MQKLDKRIVSEVLPRYINKDWRLKRLRVAAYLRVSTDSRDQENSLINQRAHYEKFIPSHPNWELVGIFFDDGVSGTSLRNRTGFHDMIEACRRGEVDLIVVKEVSRFARNISDCLNTVEALLTLDPPVGIYFENNNLNTLDTGNRVFLAVFAMFAELESELKSRSVDFGLQTLFDRGNYLCPTMNLLGYEKDGKYMIKVESEGARTVRLIYDLFLAGYAQREIADILTGLRLPTAKGNMIWTATAVTGICRNEKYCGALFMQKTYTISFLTHQSRRNVGQRRLFFEPSHHEAIVSTEEHARVLLLLRANHASPFFNHTYEIRVVRRGLLSGFIPMNAAFGGYDAGHYLGAFVMARVAKVDIKAEVACIAGVKRVRRELLGESGAATVTISRYGLAFSTGCVSLLGNAACVEILLHPSEQLLAVRKCSKRNPDAVPWSNVFIPAKELARVLYDLMNWQKEWRYKSTANCFTMDGDAVLMFDLRCCEYRLPQADECNKKNRHARAVPSEWLSDFGAPLPEQMMLCRHALARTLKKWHLGAAATMVDGFGDGIIPLTRKEAEDRVSEVRSSLNG